MSGKTNVIEPVPGGPRFRILCVADSSAALCATKPFVEPATIDTGGFGARQLAAVLHHKREEQEPLRHYPFTHGHQALFTDVLAAVESVPHHMAGGGHIVRAASPLIFPVRPLRTPPRFVDARPLAQVVVDVSSTALTAPALAEARKFGMGLVSYITPPRPSRTAGMRWVRRDNQCAERLIWCSVSLAFAGRSSRTKRRWPSRSHCTTRSKVLCPGQPTSTSSAQTRPLWAKIPDGVQSVPQQYTAVYCIIYC